MANFSKKILIGGIASTILGSTLFLVGCSINNFDWNALSNVEYKQMEYVENASTTITSLSFDFDSTDFEIKFDDNVEGVSVSYPQRQNKRGKNISKVAVTETENSLSITEQRDKYWVLFNFSLPTVTITLPTSRVYDLSIEGTTGDISLEGEGNFSNLSIDVSTGDVDVDNINVSNDLSIETSTGNSSISSVTAKNASLTASTGDVRVKNVTVAETLSMTSSTGNKTLSNNITAKQLSIETSTGDIKAKDALIDSVNISIEASTGNISATLLGNKNDYSISVKTSTGNKNISSNTDDVVDGLIHPTKTLKAKTSTGNIKIYFSAE